MVFFPTKTKNLYPAQSRQLNRSLLILGVVLAGLGLVYVIQVSSVVSLSYRLEDLKKTVQESAESAHLLQAQVAQLPPATKLQEVRAQLNLTPAQDIRYIKAGRSMSLSRR